MVNDKRINVNRLYRMIDYRNTYFEYCMKDSIITHLTSSREEDWYVRPSYHIPDGYSRYDEMFSVDVYDVIWCNLAGAEFIIENCNMSYKDYEKTCKHLYYAKHNIEEKIPINTTVYLDHDHDYIVDDELNGYIEDILLGIVTNGKGKDEVDFDKFDKRDRTTTNGLFKTYNTSAKSGHDSQCVRFSKSYQYVEDTDPYMLQRSLFYFDYDPIEYDDYAERFCFNEYKIMKKIHKKEKKLRKQQKKAEKKKNKFK